MIITLKSLLPTPNWTLRNAARLLLLTLTVSPSLLVAQALTPVVVMTSYPDNVVALFEQAFEDAHPNIDVQILWRNSDDAIATLAREEHTPVDVYWTPSPDAFARFKELNLFKPLTAQQRALPQMLGATQLSDPQGYYVATEVAGFGFAVNTAKLRDIGAAPPQDWEDLARAEYADVLALPIPSAVGYAPPMIDIVLQAYGWQRGWQLWSEIVGNANLIERGASLVTNEVATGPNAVGLSIDFFVTSAIASGRDLDFVYPRHGGLNPAHIALFQEGENPEAADSFVNFVLSKAGQLLLTDPDIRKLPVRPDIYTEIPFHYYDVFAAAERGDYSFNNLLYRSRNRVLTALFEQMFIVRHQKLQSLWTQIHTLESEGVDLREVRALLGAPLLTEIEASDGKLQETFARHSGMIASTTLSRDNDVNAITSNWLKVIDVRHEKVAALLREFTL